MGSIPDYETAIAEVIRLEAELAEANRACTLAHEGENTCRNEMIRMHEDMHTMMLSRIEQEGIYQDKIKRLRAALRDMREALDGCNLVLNGAVVEIERLQADNAKLAQVGVTLLNERDKLAYELENCNDRIAQLKSALTVAHVDVQRLQAELEELKLRYSFDAG